MRYLQQSKITNQIAQFIYIIVKYFRAIQPLTLQSNLL
nr:MAG TPA: hypothetical protein [Caudoviricetes sp.]